MLNTTDKFSTMIQDTYGLRRSIKWFYNLIVVDSCTEWPEIFKCRKTISLTTINFFLFFFFFFLDLEFLTTSWQIKELNAFLANFELSYRVHAIEILTSFLCHPGSNRQAQRFVDNFWNGILKDLKGRRHWQFLSSYWQIPNPNTEIGKSPAELMFDQNYIW